MPAQAITDLTNQVTKVTTVVKSATILINGIRDRIDAAVAAALANGATADELVPLTALSAEMDTEVTALAEAVEANT